MLIDINDSGELVEYSEFRSSIIAALETERKRNAKFAKRFRGQESADLKHERIAANMARNCAQALREFGFSMPAAYEHDGYFYGKCEWRQSLFNASPDESEPPRPGHVLYRESNDKAPYDRRDTATVPIIGIYKSAPNKWQIIHLPSGHPVSYTGTLRDSKDLVDGADMLHRWCNDFREFAARVKGWC